jgi:hypothetical protein
VLLASAVVCAVSAVGLVLGRDAEAARKAAIFGGVAGLLFGLSATFDKPAFSSADVGSGELFAEWEFWALAGFGIVAFGVQQLSLATGQLAPAMAAVSVANPLASTLIGVLVYEERLTQPGWHIALAFGALFVSFWGAVIVTLGNRELAVPGEP